MYRESFKRTFVKTLCRTAIYMAGAQAAESVVVNHTDVDPEESILPDVAAVGGGVTAWWFLSPRSDQLVDHIADRRNERKIEKQAAKSALVN